jgi:hypothetical protein
MYSASSANSGGYEKHTMRMTRPTTACPIGPRAPRGSIGVPGRFASVGRGAATWTVGCVPDFEPSPVGEEQPASIRLETIAAVARAIPLTTPAAYLSEVPIREHPEHLSVRWCAALRLQPDLGPAELGYSGSGVSRLSPTPNCRSNPLPTVRHRTRRCLASGTSPMARPSERLLRTAPHSLRASTSLCWRSRARRNAWSIPSPLSGRVRARTWLLSVQEAARSGVAGPGNRGGHVSPSPH